MARELVLIGVSHVLLAKEHTALFIILNAIDDLELVLEQVIAGGTGFASVLVLVTQTILRRNQETQLLSLDLGQEIAFRGSIDTLSALLLLVVHQAILYLVEFLHLLTVIHLGILTKEVYLHTRSQDVALHTIFALELAFEAPAILYLRNLHTQQRLGVEHESFITSVQLAEIFVHCIGNAVRVHCPRNAGALIQVKLVIVVLGFLLTLHAISSPLKQAHVQVVLDAKSNLGNGLHYLGNSTLNLVELLTSFAVYGRGGLQVLHSQPHAPAYVIVSAVLLGAQIQQKIVVDTIQTGLVQLLLAMQVNVGQT